MTPWRAPDAPALYKLMAWLSPSYPVGAFSYSSGIEWAVEAGDIRDAATLRDWVEVVLTHGAGLSDAILFAEAHRAVCAAASARLCEIAELAAAFVSSKERRLETTAQGRAFFDTTRAAWPCAALDRFAQAWDGPLAYPVAVAVASAGHDIPLTLALPAYLHALVANMISAGVRLIPLGQSDGQRTLAEISGTVAEVAARGQTATLDDLASAAVRADIAAMRHETQYTRLFRS